MRSIANLTALGVLALLLAACGSDDENPGGTSRAVKDAGPASTTAETNEKKNTAESRTTEKTMSEAKISSSGYDLTPPDEATMTLLKGQLDELALSVTCEAGTERPGTGALLKNKRTGTYVCVICKLPLFKSDTKFESGTGWPSFFKPFDRQHIKDVLDRSHGMTRTENRCARCGAHLGHLFTDGPAPTGLRYCMNSAALEFYEEGEELPELPRKP